MTNKKRSNNQPEVVVVTEERSEGVASKWTAKE